MDPLTIGSHTFTAYDYDAEGDVLFLYNAPSHADDRSGETPEGDCVSFDHDGNLISLEIIGARWRLEHDGQVKVTLPEQTSIPGEAAQLIAA